MNRKKILVWILVAIQFSILLTGCGEDSILTESDILGSDEMETPILSENSPDVNSNIENTKDRRHYDMETPILPEDSDINFDINNTRAVLEKMLENYQSIRGSITVDRIILVLIKVEIQGVIRGIPYREFGDFIVNFEIESEDNKVYTITMEGRYVSRVHDRQIDMLIYNVHNPSGHELPEPLPDFRNLEYEFNFDRTIRVIQNALGVEDENVENRIMPWVSFFFPRENIKGARRARFVANLEDGSTLLDIETEDNKNYQITLSKGNRVIKIVDLDNNATIYQR